MPTETTVEKPKQQLGMGSDLVLDDCVYTTDSQKASGFSSYFSSVYGPPALYNINALIDVCPDSVSIDKISDDNNYYEKIEVFGISRARFLCLARRFIYFGENQSH
ncbi:hypothetical protein QE152_g8582 [Popillia japonica]|uniref:Uncharacterized protein n=1 Tax=Popillia japonica TaxID=7064 RepID=A0AAW1M384_POPJA